MKQIIQSFKTGDTILEEVPAPEVGKGQILIQTTCSLVSLGTEKMLIEFGKASLIQKARQQPDRVKMVLDKIKSDGLLPTLEAVFNKLEQPIPLGYCNVGRVIAIGANVEEFSIGDRVASNGHHAEFVCVPRNLVAHIPDNVSDEEATFTVIGSIGLQGIRLLNPTIGETHVIIGLGLIGLLTAQLLIANGCNVIGLDIDVSKVQLAKSLGVHAFNTINDDAVKIAHTFTKGIGVDGVIITASAKSNDLISQAAKMCRKRGRIVLIGVIGLDINRSDFYEKELTFQVSCSYGPGRYDEDYEQKGQDYPLSFVRWTEQRNFETILQSISSKRINVKDLITERVDLENYSEIYNNIGSKSSIASIIKYNAQSVHTTNIRVGQSDIKYTKGAMAIIGSGNFTKMTMLPNLKEAPVKYIVSKGGLTSKELAKKYKILYSSTSFDDALNDKEVTLVAITTRHNLHASMVVKALTAGKNVFVEKPLALNISELNEIVTLQSQTLKNIDVGFNRRFSPHIQKIKSHLPSTSNKNFVATMNAGFIPSNVWIHDVEVGGGRIIGEACHYIDMLIFLSGSKVKSICMNSLGAHPSDNTDNASLLIKFENGDNGVINYFSNGSKEYSKERLEIYFDEKTIIMDNFRETTAYGIPGFSRLKTSQDKGHKAQFELLVKRLNEGGSALIPFNEITNTTKASFAAIQSLKEGRWINI